MSGIPTQASEILVDTPDSVSPTAADAAKTASTQGNSLVSWIVDRVNKWEDQRNRGYNRLWSEYWRMWRGQWADDDRNRQSERSRLIAPALAQAAESSVAEIEEALFAKAVWFDVAEGSVPAEQKGAALAARDLLLEDAEKANVKGAIAEAILNGALFGTGIVQVSTQVVADTRPTRDPQSQQLKPAAKDKVLVTVEAIRPDEFIPDPAGKRIEEMLGCAVRRQRPVHVVLERIEQGVYLKSALPLIHPMRRLRNYDVDIHDPQSIMTVANADELVIVEYHGKVPLHLLETAGTAKSELDDVLKQSALTARKEGDDGPLVEALVTIANDSVLLRAVPSPFTMKDRSILAFQYETVPGRFWGRGVMEKGYNPQKALDATIRAYIDALGYVAAPMLGVDSGRLPRGAKLEVRPGKVWATQGPPHEVLNPVKIGELDVNLFQTAAEMERMVQMGTGAFDTASALKNQTQSGASGLAANSMFMGAFVKRAKRAIANVDRNLVQPLITKMMWRYAQFDPARYPDVYDFTVKATLGIMAREVEAIQQTQLMMALPQEFPQVKLALAQGMLENSAISNKSQILQLVNQALQPPPPEQQQKQQHMQDLQLQAAEAEAQGKLLANQKTIAEIRETLSRANMEAHKGQISELQVQQEQQRIQLQQQDINNFQEQNRIAAQRLFIDNKKADAALISAHKKPSGKAG